MKDLAAKYASARYGMDKRAACIDAAPTVQEAA